MATANKKNQRLFSSYNTINSDCILLTIITSPLQQSYTFCLHIIQTNKKASMKVLLLAVVTLVGKQVANYFLSLSSLIVCLVLVPVASISCYTGASVSGTVVNYFTQYSPCDICKVSNRYLIRNLMYHIISLMLDLYCFWYYDERVRRIRDGVGYVLHFQHVQHLRKLLMLRNKSL
jgi:hypothetical protein